MTTSAKHCYPGLEFELLGILVKHFVRRLCGASVLCVFDHGMPCDYDLDAHQFAGSCWQLPIEKGIWIPVAP